MWAVVDKYRVHYSRIMEGVITITIVIIHERDAVGGGWGDDEVVDGLSISIFFNDEMNWYRSGYPHR